MSTIEIDSYQPTDKTQIIEIINRVCHRVPWMTPRYIPTPAWEYVLNQQAPMHHLLLVARSDTRLVGWSRLFPTDVATVVELGIGVLPDYWQQGIGTMLMERTIARARANGVTKIVLTTHHRNAPAHKLFARFGFSLTARRESYWCMEAAIV